MKDNSRVQRAVRLTGAQLRLWDRVLADDSRWPPGWSLGDRVAWVLRQWEKAEGPGYPQGDKPVR